MSDALLKKQRRQLRHRARQQGAVLEDVITSKASTVRDVTASALAKQVQKLSRKAQQDMQDRITLGEMARGGDTQAAAARRKLNDWELDTKPGGPGEYMNSKGTRKAAGKCDAARINNTLRLKGVRR